MATDNGSREGDMELRLAGFERLNGPLPPALRCWIDDEPAETVPSVAGLRTLAIAAAVLLLLASIGVWNAYAISRSNPQAQQQVAQLREQASSLEKLVAATKDEQQRTAEQLAAAEQALSFIKPTAYEQKQNLFVSFVSPDAVAEPRAGKVRVVVRNVQFACRLRWIINDKEDVHLLPMGETELELPIGSPTTAFVESLHTANWLQAVYVAVIRDKERIPPSGTALGKLPLTLMDKDIVVLHVEQPLPPWNAVCVPVRGEWMMVTLERPWADFKAEPWRQKTLKEPEELPNSALFWKRDGTAATAKHLATYFLAHRNDKGAWGRYRTPETRHFGIVVRAGQDQVSEAMRNIEQPELERAIVIALELLKRQQPPLGPSIAAELERAGVILKQEGIAIQE